uniref:Uncharacterized protein n=1 Tax=Branchiostoma floridae TaxID=7739 RepID=C3XUE4_BRAFL|eukprot:XP_002612509.1 hypothetical protein BRAFLDRAFT_214286 [Branchiostoma floridae]
MAHALSIAKWHSLETDWQCSKNMSYTLTEKSMAHALPIAKWHSLETDWQCNKNMSYTLTENQWHMHYL